MRSVAREVRTQATPANGREAHCAEKCVHRAPGVIRADEVYTIEEFRARTGLGETWRRRARRKGLRILYVNSRAFICGRDFIDFVERVATEEFRPKEPSAAGTGG
jgi:hypothetical protein